MARLTNGYTRAFNTRYQRVGPLFQGAYKAVRIENNWQLVHVCRYIHLNPVVAKLVKDGAQYPWSSCGSYVRTVKSLFPLLKEPILGQFSSPQAFSEFQTDHIGYAQSIAAYKHLLLLEE